MPVDLREIASIAGMPGLYRIVSPTRTGVIIETLTETPVRTTAQAKHRISLLHEISIYTTDPEITVPLADIFDRIRIKHGDDLPIHGKSSNAELSTFMEDVLPDYDRDRVYMSDIKKIANWYGIVKKLLNFDAPSPEAENETATSESKEGKTEKKAKTESKAAGKVEKTDEEKEEKPAKKAKAKTEKSGDEEEKPKAEAKTKKPKKSAE